VVVALPVLKPTTPDDVLRFGAAAEPPGAYPVIVHNVLGWTRTQAIVVGVSTTGVHVVGPDLEPVHCQACPAALFCGANSTNGLILAVQINPRWASTQLPHTDQFELVFLARVPPLATMTYFVVAVCAVLLSLFISQLLSGVLRGHSTTSPIRPKSRTTTRDVCVIFLRAGAQAHSALSAAAPLCAAQPAMPDHVGSGAIPIPLRGVPLGPEITIDGDHYAIHINGHTGRIAALSDHTTKRRISVDQQVRRSGGEPCRE